MKTIRAAALFAIAVLWGCAPQGAVTRTPQPGWRLYYNSKYGYEIQYPEGYELWETGLEGQRDGASIRIGLKEYQAIAPVLDGRVQPKTSEEEFPTLGMQVKDMYAGVREISVNGVPANEVQYRWTQNGDLARVEIYVRGVLFEFMAAGGTGDFHATDWWAIISTFRFMEG